VTHDGDLVEIIHPGPAEVAVRNRKTGGFDDVRHHVKARAETKNRSGVLGDVRLEKRNLHVVTVLQSPK
jgi:hypothetical protein